MKSRKLVRTLSAAGAAAIAIATLVAVTPSSAATPHRTAKDAPATPGSRYLALGDSIPFGFRESQSTPTPNYSKPGTLVGYPELVAQDLGLRLTNAACPGETTSHMIHVGGQDNGCAKQVNGSPGYTAGFPLHTQYKGSQLGFAVSFLKAHPNTKLVTLMIGANDGLICQAKTADHCTSPTELSNLLAGIKKRVTTILTRIRHNGHYKGQLVLVNYYSINSASNDANAQSQALDGTLKAASSKFDVKVADAYSLWTKASKNAPGNDTCAAGLLTIIPSATPVPCGIHPSLAGQALLATAAERVVKKG
jgi:lysophospholipase L1-like esterase